MPEIRIVELSPPQPCGILNPQSGQICGRPALRATVEAAPRACAGAAGYVPQHVTVLTTIVHVPDDALPGAI